MVKRYRFKMYGWDFKTTDWSYKRTCDEPPTKANKTGQLHGLPSLVSSNHAETDKDDRLINQSDPLVWRFQKSYQRIHSDRGHGCLDCGGMELSKKTKKKEKKQSTCRDNLYVSHLCVTKNLNHDEKWEVGVAVTVPTYAEYIFSAVTRKKGM